MRFILKIFLVCFCILVFGFNIEGITFKKLNKIDKGTISIYLKNESQIPLKIEELYSNDIKIDKIPSDLILWYQLTPPEIEPEKYGQLKIKKVKEIEYPEEKEVKYEIKGDKLKIKIDTLKITKQYLIETERK